MRDFCIFRGAAVTLVALLTALTLAPGEDAGASGEGYVLVKIADTNDLAPGTAGGTFSNFSKVKLDNNTQVAFEGTVSGGTAGHGIFLHGGGNTSAAVLAGDPARDTGGTYNAVGNPAVSSNGQMAFTGSISGGSAIQAIFLRSAGSIQAHVLQGQAAPGTGGGTFFPGMVPAAVNDGGNVAFWSGVSVGTVNHGFFLGPGTGPAIIALPGDPAPGTGGGSFGNLPGTATINGSGEVAFNAPVFGGTANRGIFSRSGGTTNARVVHGDSAPSTGGGTFSESLSRPSLNDSGSLGFSAGITGGTVPAGIFLLSGGNTNALVLAGQPAPGSGGGDFASFGAASLNNGGEVAFLAGVSGGTASQGIFLWSAAVSPVALLGDVAPGTGGGVFSSLEHLAFNDKGEVAFRARISGGDASKAIFLALPSKTDSDGDGLTNEEEINTHGTDPLVTDTDGDGCTDGQEVGNNETAGGLRDPTNEWDYFNPTNDGRNRIDDILAVITHYRVDEGEEGYETRYDRTLKGPNVWNTGPPDGKIRIDDVLNIIHQYRHDCA